MINLQFIKSENGIENLCADIIGLLCIVRSIWVAYRRSSALADKEYWEFCEFGHKEECEGDAAVEGGTEGGEDLQGEWEGEVGELGEHF